MKASNLLLIVSISLLGACTSDPLEENQTLGPWNSPKGSASQLTQEEFNNLPAISQYKVANKLVGTFYKGIPVNQYFELSLGLENPRIVSTTDAENLTEKPISIKTNLLASIADTLNTRLVDKAYYAGLANTRNNFNDSNAWNPVTKSLAYIHEFPISRDLFEAWMAYELTNTILFSPASEIDSASYLDAQKVYDNLVNAFDKNMTISQIVNAHENSEANWRRFRSPEDNTREMIEIFLGLFDRDEDVPRAAKACKNWSISSPDSGYQLTIDRLNPNTEPQQVLGQTIISCEDFFTLVANYPLMIPRVTTVLVDHFFPNLSSSRRAGLVQSIVETNPVYFHQIFAAIIFSREYLLNNERPRSYEETFFSIANRLYWKQDPNFISNLTSNNSSRLKTLMSMKQPAMTLKLGRWKDQPLDSISFANYYKGLREDLLVRFNGSSTGGQGWDREFIRPADALSDHDFYNYLFLTALLRKPTDDEIAGLDDLVAQAKAKGSISRYDIAEIVFDYIALLPETYMFSVN